jgi:glycosyltransferase involved in cell wall biosynthesis
MHITVIMGVYNGEATVARAVRSIQDQTYPDWDMIIVDDGSTDRSGAILEELASQDRRLSILTQPSNRGLAASLNLGLRQARGPWIARMDDDDISLPQRFEQQVNFLSAHPAVDVLGTGAYVLDEGGHGSPKLYRDLRESHSEIVSHLVWESPFIHPTIMARKEFFTSLGGYDEGLRRAQDRDLFYRGYKYFTYHNLKTPLIYYYVQPEITLARVFYRSIVLIKAGRRGHELMKCALPILKEACSFILYKVLPASSFHYLQILFKSLKMIRTENWARFKCS